MAIDVVITIASGLLALLSFLELVLLRRIFSVILKLYIAVMGLFFLSVSLAHIHPIFEYMLWVTSISGASFKVFLGAMMRGKFKKQWRSRYMADIYKLTGIMYSAKGKIK